VDGSGIREHHYPDRINWNETADADFRGVANLSLFLSFTKSLSQCSTNQPERWFVPFSRVFVEIFCHNRGKLSCRYAITDAIFDIRRIGYSGNISEVDTETCQQCNVIAS